MTRRASALSGLAAGVGYLAWRVTAGTEGVVPWLSFGLLFGEFLLVAIYALDVWAAWPDDDGTDGQAPTSGSFAALITAYGEPEVVVRTCLLACRDMTGCDEIHVVDDGHSDGLRELAAKFGVEYHTRPNPAGGRAGALAFGFDQIDTDFVVVLSATETPHTHLIRRVRPVLGSDVAVVQVRLDYINDDSVIHSSRSDHDDMWELDVVSPAADSRGAATWSGAGAVVRRQALDDIGGYPLDSFGGELVATVRLQGAGWTIRYLNRPLVRGVAPRNLTSYLVQQTGAARGQLQLLMSADSPLRKAGLTFGQRCHHLHVVARHLSALAYALVGITLLVSLAQGLMPVTLTPLGIVLIGCWLAGSTIGRVSAGRGRLKVGATVSRNLIVVEARLRAILMLVRHDRRRAGVARFSAANRAAEVVHHLPVLVGFVLALESLLVLRLLTAVTGFPLAPLVGAELIAALAWGVVTAWSCLRVLGVFARRRQERDHQRLPVDYFGSVDGTPAWIVDLSAAGAGVVTSMAVERDQDIQLGIDLSYTTVNVGATVRSVVPNQDGTRYRLGVQLTSVSDIALDEILRTVSLGATRSSLRDDSRSLHLVRGDVIDLTFDDGSTRAVEVSDIVSGQERDRLVVSAKPALAKPASAGWADQSAEVQP